MKITEKKKMIREKIIMTVYYSSAVIIGAGMGIVSWILVWVLFVHNKIDDLF